MRLTPKGDSLKVLHSRHDMLTLDSTEKALTMINNSILFVWRASDEEKCLTTPTQ